MKESPDYQISYPVALDRIHDPANGNIDVEVIVDRLDKATIEAVVVGLFADGELEVAFDGPFVVEDDMTESSGDIPLD